MELCSTELCTGCFACKSVCPKDAITIGYDSLMKSIPVIDTNKCVNCGLCVKTCPVLNKSESNVPNTCLAAWTNNNADRKDCASGGIATALSRVIYDRGGKVFGCTFDDELNLDIKMAESLDDLERFKSSKYVQSSTADSYEEVRRQLMNDMEVLYIGTPCQIDGLKHFLKKDYDKLYLVDIICHGVSPIDYLKQYVNKISKGKKISNVGFRGSNDFFFTLYEGEKIIYCVRSYMDLYYEEFLRSVIYRDNCYNCRYANTNRVSDLTIGDFWGLDKSTLSEKYDGRVSQILVNTSKGQKLLETVGNYIHTEPGDMDVAIQNNVQLQHPSEAPYDRKVFVDAFKGDFVRASYKTSIGKRILKDKIKKRLSFLVFIKRIIRGNK